MRGIAFGLIVSLMTISQAFAGANDYFTETTKDFGPAPIGPVLTHYFQIKNKTNSTITMGTPRIGCGCVSATLMKAQLAPGEVTHLVAYMDTKKIPSHQRNTSKTVTVNVPFLSPYPEEVVLRVTTVGREDLFYSQDQFNFGTINKGSDKTMTIKVTLFGNTTWNIKEASSNGAFVKVESKEAVRQGSEVSYQITAKIDPACPAGYWASEVVLNSNTPGLEALRIPVAVNVVTPIAINPGELKFGDIKAGSEPTTKQVILQGTQPFKVIEVKGADGEISVTPITDGSRKDHIVRVALKVDSAQDLNKKIQIMTDNKDMPMVILPVSAIVKK